MLSYQLNQKILKLAPRFTVSMNAPGTFGSLQANRVAGLVVFEGASLNTIYGYPHVNHAFRAWHDSLHLKLNAPFTLEGETFVALEQARLAGSDQLGDIIMAEVYGQAKYFETYGEFPNNQVEFITNYLKSL